MFKFRFIYNICLYIFTKDILKHIYKPVFMNMCTKYLTNNCINILKCY